MPFYLILFLNELKGTNYTNKTYLRLIIVIVDLLLTLHVGIIYSSLEITALKIFSSFQIRLVYLKHLGHSRDLTSLRSRYRRVLSWPIHRILLFVTIIRVYSFSSHAGITIFRVHFGWTGNTGNRSSVS